MMDPLCVWDILVYLSSDWLDSCCDLMISSFNPLPLTRLIPLKFSSVVKSRCSYNMQS